jgi:hypothetical protein
MSVVGTVKTCFMTNTSKVDSEGYVIFSAKDLSVKGLLFLGQNKKIEFLPASPYQTFSNLEAYSASRCSIKNVSYQNFMKLGKLRRLNLYDNKIEIIASDVFKDLAALEDLDLGKI